MASFSSKTQYDNYTLWLNVNESSTNTANNTSTVDWNLYIINGGRRFSISNFHYYASINGVEVANFTGPCDTTDVAVSGGEHFLASGSQIITHENDGTKTISCYASCSGRSSSGHGPGTGELSGSYTLTNIPRKAELITTYDFNDDENPIFYFSNPGSFWLSFSLEWNNQTQSISRILDAAPSSPYTLVLTDAERDRLRKACAGDSMPIRMVIATSIGGSYSQWSWQDKTFYRKRRINVFPQANVRKLGDPYVYTGDSYKRGIPYVYKDGSWKMGTS